MKVATAWTYIEPETSSVKIDIIKLRNSDNPHNTLILKNVILYRRMLKYWLEYSDSIDWLEYYNQFYDFRNQNWSSIANIVRYYFAKNTKRMENEK